MKKILFLFISLFSILSAQAQVNFITAAQSSVTATYSTSISQSIATIELTTTSAFNGSTTTDSLFGSINNGTTWTFISRFVPSAGVNDHIFNITPSIYGWYKIVHTKGNASAGKYTAIALQKNGCITTNVSNAVGILPVVNGGTGQTLATGTGAVVRKTSPEIASPTISGSFFSKSITSDDSCFISVNGSQVVTGANSKKTLSQSYVETDTSQTVIYVQGKVSTHNTNVLIDSGSITMNPQSVYHGTLIKADTIQVRMEAVGVTSSLIRLDTTKMLVSVDTIIISKAVPTYTSQAAANAALGVGILVKINSASPAIKYLYLTEFYDEDFFATEEKYFYFRRNRFLK